MWTYEWTHWLLVKYAIRQQVKNALASYNTHMTVLMCVFSLMLMEWLITICLRDACGAFSIML